LIGRPLAAAIRVLRVIGISALSGFVAGAVTGLASRVAMRIAGLMAGADALGSPAHAVVSEGRSSGGQVVGEATFGGTLEVVFGSALDGVLGGLLYLAFRPWLARLGPWRGVAFGLLLLLTFGALLFGVGADTAAFRRYGPPALNVALFAALYPVFGLVVAPAADGLERALPGRRPAGLWAWVGYIPVGLAAAIATLFVTAAIGSAVGPILAGRPRFEPFALPVATLVVALAARRISSIGPRARAAGYALVAAPVLVGLPFTIGAIVTLIVP